MSWVGDTWDRLTNSGKYKYKNPAETAMPYMDKAQGYLEQAPGMLHEGYDPYVQQGRSAYDVMNPIFTQMSQDPAAYMKKLMSGYEGSPEYSLQRDEALKAASATAAAGGRRGTSQDMMNQARISESLMGDEMQRWLQNTMGLQTQGLQGQQGFYNKGFEANNLLQSGLLGNLGDLANLQQSKGSLAFQGQTNKNQNQSDLLSSLLSLAGAGLGFAFGGMPGAALGGGLGKATGSLFDGGGGGGGDYYAPPPSHLNLGLGNNQYQSSYNPSPWM